MGLINSVRIHWYDKGAKSKKSATVPAAADKKKKKKKERRKCNSQTATQISVLSKRALQVIPKPSFSYLSSQGWRHERVSLVQPSTFFLHASPIPLAITKTRLHHVSSHLIFFTFLFILLTASFSHILPKSLLNTLKLCLHYQPFDMPQMTVGNQKKRG